MDLGPYYAILPSGGAYTVDDYCAALGGCRVAPGFSYNSGTGVALGGEPTGKAIQYDGVIYVPNSPGMPSTWT